MNATLEQIAQDAAAQAAQASSAAATSEAQAAAATSGAHVNVAVNNNTMMREVKFNFRKDSLGNKRASIVKQIPVPTLAGLVAIIEAGGKQLDLVLDTLADVVYAQARQQVDAEDYTDDKWDVNALAWDVIANLPKAERRGGGIPKETWEAFSADYIQVMPAVTGKTLEQTGNAAKLFVAKLAPVKTNKKVIAHLQDLLNIWFTNTPNAEDYADVYEFLSNKAETLLKADEASLLANL